MNSNPTRTCPACGAEMNSSSGGECPVCGWVPKSKVEDVHWDDEVGVPSERPRYLIAATAVFLAPLVVGLVSEAVGWTNLAIIAFLGSPLFGVATGVLLGLHLHATTADASGWVGAAYVLMCVVACPIITLCGCTFAGRFF